MFERLNGSTAMLQHLTRSKWSTGALIRMRFNNIGESR